MVLIPSQLCNTRAHLRPNGIRCITSKSNACIFLSFEYNNNCSEGRGKRNEAPDKLFGVRHPHRQPHLQVPKEQKEISKNT